MESLREVPSYRPVSTPRSRDPAKKKITGTLPGRPPFGQGCPGEGARRDGNAVASLADTCTAEAETQVDLSSDLWAEQARSSRAGTLIALRVCLFADFRCAYLDRRKFTAAALASAPGSAPLLWKAPTRGIRQVPPRRLDPDSPLLQLLRPGATI